MYITVTEDDFERLSKEFTKTQKAFAEKCGTRLYEQVMRNIDVSRCEDAVRLKRGVTKILSSNGKRVTISCDDTTLPDMHRAENGYSMIKDGKTIGWIPGKHMYRNAANMLEVELETLAGTMIQDLVGDIFG